MGSLSALAVKNAKPGTHQDGDGLILVVKSSGPRYWVLRKQFQGTRRDYSLGSTRLVSLMQAREKALQWSKQIAEGVDPRVARKEALAAAASIPTFKEAAEAAHREQKPVWRNAKHDAQWLSSLKQYAFPFIGDCPVDKIDSPMICELLLPIWLSKPETGRRVRQRVGAVLDWSYSKGHRTSEAPVRPITKGLPRQPRREGHFAALPFIDVPALMADLSGKGGLGALALRFAILTAARSGEVRGARWSEIDLANKTWTIPRGRMKADKEHIVPLAAPALDILNTATLLRKTKGDALVFPGTKGRPLSDMTLLKALKQERPGMTVHGFRSSFRDWAGEKTNAEHDVIEKCLAHTISNKVEAAYYRTNLLEKRRKLMERWAKYAVQ